MRWFFHAGCVTSTSASQAMTQHPLILVRECQDVAHNASVVTTELVHMPDESGTKKTKLLMHFYCSLCCVWHNHTCVQERTTLHSFMSHLAFFEQGSSAFSVIRRVMRCVAVQDIKVAWRRRSAHSSTWTQVVRDKSSRSKETKTSKKKQPHYALSKRDI